MKPAENEVGGGVRLPKSFYERPLTPKEAQFATDNINIVWWYLDQQGLDRAEWFDVVIFRYLISVKRWFALPDLQKVKFVTVACNAMRSAIGNARRKSAKEPQTVSLYEPIPGTEDLLYIDTIAAPEIMQEGDVMEIKYNVQAPAKKAFNGGAKSEEVKAIEDFLTRGNAKNMCFEYGTEKEAKTKLSTVSSHKRKWNEKNPKKYDAYRVGNCIYIVRLTGKKG